MYPKLKSRIFTLALALAASATTGTVALAQCGNNANGFEQWKAGFAQQAQASGVGQRGLQALAQTRYASSTIARKVAAVKSFFKFMEQSCYLTDFAKKWSEQS